MERSLRFLGALAGCCALVLYVTGCGVTTTSGVASNGSDTPGTAQATSATRQNTPSSTPGATPVPGQITSTPSSGATPVSGLVTITVDKQHYATNELITASIHNGLPAPIFVADHQTSCTIVSLKMLNNGGWTTIRGCRIMTPTRMVEIGPGTSTTVRLSPGAGQFTSTPWVPGTYQATLGYGSSQMTTGPAYSSPVYSAVFTIS
jgi:hypothetical protein